MKAIVFRRYGPPDVLELAEVDKPAPQADEVLIQIHATTASAGDCEIRRSKFPLWLWLPIRLWLGLFRPRKNILGQELSGEVEAVGKAVTRFKKGDLVFGATGFALGAYAEYACLPEDAEGAGLAIKPVNLLHEEAAALPVAGLEALLLLRKGSVKRGEKVLIVGAGGSIGSFAIQLAKSYGAEVTGADSTGKLEFLRSLGADHVLDFTRDEIAKRAEAYDVILDVVGKSPFARSVRALKPSGRFLMANPRLSDLLRKRWISKEGGKKAVAGAGRRTNQDLMFLKDLVEAGKIRSVIDRRYPLAQMADAHRYVESGEKKGNVVVTIAPGSP